MYKSVFKVCDRYKKLLVSKYTYICVSMDAICWLHRCRPQFYLLPYVNSKCLPNFDNIQAKSYPGIPCCVDQAVLDSKNHDELQLGIELIRN